jgi:hypothetical protein
MRFSDQVIHAMLHLSGSKTSYSIATLHQAVKGFTKELLMPAIERGWVLLRPSAKGASIVEITEAGEKWLRKLVDLSEAEPKV